MLESSQFHLARWLLVFGHGLRWPFLIPEKSNKQPKKGKAKGEKGRGKGNARKATTNYYLKFRLRSRQNQNSLPADRPGK